MDECKSEICLPACVKRHHTGLAETTTGDEEDDEGESKRGERENMKKQEGGEKMKIMCLYCSASQRNPTGILSSPTLTTDCE